MQKLFLDIETIVALDIFIFIYSFLIKKSKGQYNKKFHVESIFFLMLIPTLIH